MSDQSTSAKDMLAQWPFDLPEFAEAFQDQMKSLFDGQGELLEETQKLMAAWTKRGQTRIEDGLQTFQAAAACKDPAEVAMLYGDWLRKSASQLLADMNDTRSEALRFAEIGQKSMMALFQRGADAAAGAVSSPFTVKKGETRRAKNSPRSESTRQTAARNAAE